MTSLDELDGLFTPSAETVIPTTPRKCRRHVWVRFARPIAEIPGPAHYDELDDPWVCSRCHAVRDPIRSRRGKQSRNYGNRAELAVARKYGGEKIGHAGGPVDVRGKDFNTQVKTHRRTPPREWVGVFNAMAANRERIPRLLLRFVTGAAPIDYFVFQADDFLDWFGRDEETP